MLKTIGKELKTHAPFTIFGALVGIVLVAVIVYTNVPRGVSERLFHVCHPLHVLLSALVTAGVYRIHSKGRIWATIAVGYFGSIGIATLSDCVIPYVGEYLLGLPNRGIHLGFVENPWLVNGLAIIGIGIACLRPKTKFPHAGHVLLSTSASLFHMTMALGEELTVTMIILIPVFLFLAVWVPCCTSDIVFPLLFSRKRNSQQVWRSCESDACERIENENSDSQR
jgi:hypothetical protein